MEKTYTGIDGTSYTKEELQRYSRQDLKRMYFTDADIDEILGVEEAIEELYFGDFVDVNDDKQKVDSKEIEVDPKTVNDEWQIPFISDSGFITTLTGKEYALYCALKTIALRDTPKEQYILFDDDMTNAKLSNELQLYGGLNKTGEKKPSVISRQTIGKLKESLIKKGILTRKDYKTKDGVDSTKNVYYITMGKGLKFAMIEKNVMKKLTRCYDGNAVKLYVYLKGLFEGKYKDLDKNSRVINREVICEAIGLKNKKGEVTKKQKDRLTDYLKALNGTVIEVRREDIRNKTTGQIRSRLYLYDVYDDFKNFDKINK